MSYSVNRVKTMNFTGGGKLSLFLTAGFLALTLSAAEVVWKGGGETAAWSDGSNWEGGTAPKEGDTAVIPQGKVALWTQSDAGFINALAGIKLNGEMEVSGMTAATTLTVPLSGNGIFRGLNGGEKAASISSGTYYYLSLNNDNRDFTGTFAFTNCGVCAKNNLAFGGADNRCTLIWNSGESSNYRRLYLMASGHYNANMFLSQPGYDRGMIFATCDSATYLDGDIDLTGPAQFHANTSNKGLFLRGKLTNSGKGAYKFFPNVHLEGEVNLTWSNNSQYGGGFYLGGGNGNIKNMGHLYADGNGILFSAANVIGGTKPGDMCYWLQGNGQVLRLYLNGYDQNWYCTPQNGKGFVVSSTEPATFRLLNFKGADKTLSAANMLREYVSFDVCATNASNGKYTTTVKNTHCTTAGGLLCGAGTFVVGDNAAVVSSTSFSNLTSLVTYDEGSMKIYRTDINPENGITNLSVLGTSSLTLGEGVSLDAVRADISATATLSIAAGSVVKVSKRTYLDGEELAKGIYGKVGGTYPDGTPIPLSRQLSCLTGDGYLDTNGRRGMVILFH